MTAFSYIRASDGMTVTETEALDASRALKPGYRFAGGGAGGSRWMQPGDRLGFDITLMDAAHRPAPLTLRDAAGLPLTLTDVDTGQTLRLNADLIAAIEAEAAKLSMSVADYVKSVLRYSWEQAKLTGSTNPGSPKQQEAN